MNEDTINLLKECNSGCKMATNSMEQMNPYIDNDAFKTMVNNYNKKHIDLGDKCHELLNSEGENEKDPQSMQKIFSWMKTEVQLRMKEDDEKIAEMLADGCHMGIKSLSKYLKQYKEATPDSINLTMQLIKEEQEFYQELLHYL